MNLLKFTCADCGWTKSIPLSWKGAAPRFCPNSKCDQSLKKGKGKSGFMLNPSKLLQEEVKPVISEQKAPKMQQKPKKKGKLNK